MVVIDIHAELSRIVNRLEEIQPIASASFEDDIVFVEHHAKDISALIAETGTLLAKAKQIKRVAIGSEIMNNLRDLSNELLPASIAKMNIDANVAGFTFAEDLADRLNAGLTHKLSLCITLISKYKEEMRLHNMNPKLNT